MGLGACKGTAQAHCCHPGDGHPCSYLVIDSGRIACGLRLQVDSWEKVYAMPEYQPVRTQLRSVGINEDCGDWPPPGVTCATCGAD